MEALLQKIKSVKVLVLGDIMLDHYIWGDAERISPEAPVPVVQVHRDSYVAGGAANVAVNIARLGAQSECAGSMGRDDAAEKLISILRENDVFIDSAFRYNSIPTILKSRIIVRQQQLARIDREQSPSCYRIDDDESWRILQKKLDLADAVILSDYAKGVLSEELVQKVTEYMHAKGKLVTLDPKPKRKLAYHDVDLMTPNRDESLQLAEVEWEYGKDFPAEEVCRKIWEKYAPRHLIVTMGAQGMLISKSGKIEKQIPTFAQEVFDVSGAGDTVIATLTVALAAGANIEEAAHLANYAAGVVVGKLGTATASPEEILNFIKNYGTK